VFFLCGENRDNKHRESKQGKNEGREELGDENHSSSLGKP
jgi:hypothetical protein